MTIGSTSLVKVGLAAGAAAAALAFVAPGIGIRSDGVGPRVHQHRHAVHQFGQQRPGRMRDKFSGRVTSDDGSGHVQVAIDNIAVSCSDGTRVTPNALPWTLDLLEDRATRSRA